MDSSNLDDIGPLIDPDAPNSEQFVRPVDRFRRTAAGTVVAAGLLGLRDVLEARSERDKPAIVSEARERERSDPIQVVLDFDHPERSVAIIRRPHPLAGD